MEKRIKLLRSSIKTEDGSKMTQDAFAAELGVSKNYICQLEAGTRVPSDGLVKLICAKHNVNENWIRTGEGEMFLEKTMDEELSEWIGRLQFSSMNGDRAAVMKKKLLLALKHIEHEETWEDLYKIAEELVKSKTE